MIKHIVMWKLDNDYSEQEKEEILNTLKSKLLNLHGKIDALRSIEVHLNAKDAATANYDILLDTTFDTFAQLETYANHPEHLKVGEYMGGIRKTRACVDYEV